MGQKKKLERASCHSGRANKQGVAYNANHNTMEQARSKQPHIDPERMCMNSYLQYMSNGSTVKHYGGDGGYDSRKHEMQRFKELYGKGIEERNERYRASGHKERCKTMAQIYKDPKTCPTEIIFQVGNSESETDKEKRTSVMVGAWAATMREFQEKYGSNFIPLDSALHRDEAEDHIHFRFTLGAVDKFGHMVPNQSAALEAMGFKADPERARGRYNNPLIAFTDELRETYYRECERRGITINREVISESRRQRDLLAVKCDGFRKELEKLEQEKAAALAEAKQAQQDQAEAERAAQTAQEALEKAVGDTNTLNDQIKALEASQSALEAQNEHLVDRNAKLEERLEEVKAEGREIVAENKKLKEDNEQLQKDNNELKKTNGNLSAEQLKLQIQIQELQNKKAEAERKAAQAKADREAALAAAREMEKHQKELYRIYNGHSAKTHGEVPAQKENKLLGKAARPACVLVEKDSLDNLEKAARYNCMVDYAQEQMAKLDKKIAENEIIQQQKAQLDSQQMEINRLQQQARENEKTIMQQGNTIHLQQQVLQMHGLDGLVQQFSQNQEQTKEHHVHHRR